MATYTVHAPPPRRGETTSAPERFVFVRDGFHIWAFVFAPLWFLSHRLWLAFVVYILGSAFVGIAFAFFRVPTTAQAVIALLIALLIGFEASSIRRWTLTRRHWTTLGFVVGEDAEMAERRFFAEWALRTNNSPAPSASTEPKYSTAVQLGPSAPSDVIGLFPEPGGRR